MNRMSILVLLFCGCQAASASHEPTPLPSAKHPFELTERYVVAMESSSASAASHTSELAKISEQIARLEDASRLIAGQQCDILEVVQSLSPKSAAVPPEPTQDLEDFISEWYRGPWTYPGDITSHLRDAHGITDAAGMSVTDQEKLHAAIHEKEAASTLAAAGDIVLPTEPTNPQPAIKQATSTQCPGGVCPIRSHSTSGSWTYSRPITRAMQRRAARGR